MSPPVHSETIDTEDGARLHVHDTGGVKPIVVLANGLGGPLLGWKHQLEYLRERYRLVSWDYRGLFGSTLPPGPDPDLSVATHAADLRRVLEALGVGRVAAVGWSMGAQVLLELNSQRPELMSHLVFLNGTFGRGQISGAMPLVAESLPKLLERAEPMSEASARLLKRASRWPETALWLKRLGVMGQTLDEELFREIAAEFAHVDIGVYARMLREPALHNAAALLKQVTVPALFVVGDRDPFTRQATALELAGRVRGAETLVVRGATHYAALEYPELVNLRIEKFFRERGLG